MAHLVENSFRQAMEEAEKSGKDLERAMNKVEELQADVQKYAEKKGMLEGKISRVSRDAKNSATRVKESELEAVAKTLGETFENLAEVQFVPPNERYATFSAEFEKLKLDTLSSFDSDFDTAVAQFKVLHPGLDLSGLEIDKIVVDS